MNPTPFLTIGTVLAIAVHALGSARAEGDIAATLKGSEGLVSQADSSGLVAAVVDGLDPNTTVISSSFFCYGKDQLNLSQYLFEFSVDGNAIEVSFSNSSDVFRGTIEPGKYDSEFYAVYAESEDSPFTLEFNEFGQEIYATDANNPYAGCFQQGAAHEAALHRFELNTPTMGKYSCAAFDATTNNDSAVSIEILEGNRYSLAGQVGNMNWSGITTNYSSDLLFLSGPLEGSEATYSEDALSGRQVLQFSESSAEVFLDGSAVSSSAQGTQCSRKSEPRPYMKYGKNTAPVANKPKVSLQGKYMIDASFVNNEAVNMHVKYVEFTTDGYLHSGLPSVDGVNCALTLPNGLPMCKQYQFDGKFLSVVTPWGSEVDLWNESDIMNITLNRDGSLKTLYQYPVDRLTPVKPEDVIGEWESNEVRSSGIASCIVGNCRSSITDRGFEFRKNGEFKFALDGKTSRYFDSGMSTSMSNGSEEDRANGTYQISNNVITLIESDGHSTQLPVHITSKGALAIGEIQYLRK